MSVFAFALALALPGQLASAPAGNTTPPLVVEVRGVPKPKPRALDAAAIDEGRKLYAMRCQGCHGASGHGDGPVGRALRPSPQKLSDALWQARVTDAEMRQAIVEGGLAVKKSPAMPAHKDLSPAAVDAIIAFVRSLRSTHGTVSVTVMTADGRDITTAADADRTGFAKVVVPGVTGKVTVLGVIDESGAPACTVDVPQAAGATVRCEK